MTTTHRFKVIPVKELNHDKISFQPSEIIPLINIENDIPSPPPVPSSFTLINETKKSSPRLFNSFKQRLKTSSSTIDLRYKNDTSLSRIHSKSTTNLNVNKEPEEPDSYNSTIHSNNTLDTNSLRLTNKFLHELRSKHRELRNKKHDLSIDQRLALNRYHRYHQDTTRAQDIFDIHFELYDDDDDNIQNNLADEDFQEKIRNDIFHELDRQRMKQFHKQHRQLVLGRALLLFITSLLAFMSITLIYVVIHLYDRAKYVDTKLPDTEFISMIYDTATNI